MTLTELDKEEGPRSASPEGVFARVAGFAHRHRWLALLLWTAVLAGVWAGASVMGDDYRNDNSLPGTESQAAADLLARHGAARTGDTLQVVLAGDGGLRAPGVQQRVESMLDGVAGLPHVAEVHSPYQAGDAVFSTDGTIGYATIVLDIPSTEMTKAEVEPIHAATRRAAGDGLRVELGGDAARLLGAGETSAAEGIGILVALVVLVFMFGTVIAAGLPIMVALFAVGSTLGAIVLASQVFTIADWVPPVMILVGLGVGIDYALLVFARYRYELVRGMDTEQATKKALDVAGRSVFVAGSTVIVALLGLVALGLGALRGMALCVALTVLVTMIASLTLLPALLGVFGRRFARIFTARAEKRAAKGRPEEGAAWRRLAAGVQRRPLAAMVAAAVLLGALSVPALGMRLGFGDAGSDASGSTSREAYDLLTKGFGPGFNGPLIVVTDGGAAAAAAAAPALSSASGVAAVADPVPTPDGTAATTLVFPDSAPSDGETADLVSAIRDDVLPEVSARTGAEYLVGGPTAAADDYAAKVSDRMVPFIVIVVGLSLLLLAAVFRSLLIPLKAALLNLLSIGAALGAMTLVFQEGLFGVEKGPIEAWMPVMIFALVFGLSMDYEVFLVSRIREEWLRTGDPVLAVREGLAHTGSLITAAAAIMIAVFGSFVLSEERILQQAGFGMAVAILVDAVIIRCLIVPAAMQLMGRRAWWLPAPLERLLPQVRA
ncbi:MMPL family transporter [Actinomadura sp. NAK00032]|uniref:MMPL family transporter n=1 Tax=Actinomadura sp. NAK00032 TaxID=2742128 RepID=UPI0015921229|nr:MMPL family transporter [Actinomadura sp. NAK00032]QKW39681.1 MMPL family transporter [Actinomadura sp. NAK00032]